MRRALVPSLVLLTALAGAFPPAAPRPQAAAQGSGAQEPGAYQGAGDLGGFWNVVPPGQDGVLNGPELLQAQGGTYPPHFNDQTPLYEELVYEGGLPVAGARGEPLLGITDGDLERFFKDASFGVDPSAGDAAIEDMYSPADRDDVVVLRDAAFGVPHIYGTTRDGTMFGVGYATAEDRLFLMDVLRHVGRARLSEFLGASEGNKAMDREQLLVAPYREEELVAQAQAICELGDEGAQICADADAYLAGVNRYIEEAEQDPGLLPGEYVALQRRPEPFVRADIVAIASLVGGIFGRGGGAEFRASQFLAQLESDLGADEAARVVADLRAADDPEAPVTTARRFPYDHHDPAAFDPSSAVDVAPGTFVGAFDDAGDGGGAPFPPLPGLGVADGPFGPIDLRTPFGMSNAILASGTVTDGGVPIAVFGPQTGYFTPQLLVETDVHGPGIDARGVAFAGTNLYVQLGRGRGYAWSATSAGGDNVDQWAVELCEPDGGEPTRESTSYVRDGQCRPMDVFDHTQVAIPTAGGIPDPGGESIVYTETVKRLPDFGNGPLVGTAETADGRIIGIVEQRSTYGAELRSAVGFLRINDPDYMAAGVEAFNRAFDGVDYTFNWFYVDDQNIAYKHSCRCPIRDPRTNPDLLTWGDGRFDWTGQFLAPEQQPQAVDPEEGFFANWNNKQAPGFRANDAEYSYSATYRREFLAVRMRAAIASGTPLTRATMVNIAEDAGTVDLQGQEIWPLALEVMGAAPPPGLDGDPGQLVAMRAVLAEWVASGGHRRDVDRDGAYDHATAVAIGDVWLRTVLERTFRDDLGDAYDLLPQRVEDHPRQGVGSAFNGGQANYLDKILRMALGAPVQGPYSRPYCGTDRATCAQVLWQALADAAEVLASAPPEEPSCEYPDAYRFGSADVAEWAYPASCDDIVQSPAGVVAAPPMRWVNRPTFQQVAQPSSRIGRVDGASRIETAVATSRQAFGDGAGTVVLASASGFADSVAGTPLAAALDAPLLLVDRDAVPAAVEREVVRLGATQAVVLGGPAAVSDGVLGRLGDLDLEVRRVAGPDRYATAVAIAREVAGDDALTRVVVASGEDFPDALAAAPFAVADDRAVVLTAADALPAAVADAVDAGADVVVAGGPSAVADTVLAELQQDGATVRRIAGADRYATAGAFARAARGLGVPTDVVHAVTGAAFPDALTAGAAAARTGGSLVLLAPSTLAAGGDAATFLGEVASGVRRLWLHGGQSALPSALRAELEALLPDAIAPA